MSFAIDMPKPSPNPRTAGRAKSCTRCRQAKVACDARKTLTESCSRCKLKNLDCRFDANFKRVSTRKLTEEISHGLHALRSMEQNHPLGEPSFNEIYHLETKKLVTIPENKPLQNAPAFRKASTQEDTPQWPMIIDSDMIQSYTIGKLDLGSEMIVELFQHFGTHYLPYMMFLQPCTSTSDLLARSPLLFWTIILVASQDHARFGDFYPILAVEHEGLLSPVLHRAIQKTETIHALLILCLWPVPQSRHFYNPAWNYVGLAINAAMQLNCHNPLGPKSGAKGWNGLGHVTVKELSNEDQARTWLGCFWVGTVVAAFYGLPPSMSTKQQLKSIDRAIGTISNSFPPWWSPLFSIFQIANTAMDVLGNLEDHAAHFSLTKLFDSQLDEIKALNYDIWRSELEIEWCNVKLYLYALIFTIPAYGDPSQSVQIQIERQAVLHKAFRAASDLITEIARLGQLDMSDSYPGGLLHFIPKPYFTSLFNATTFLFRFMATCVGRTPAQENLATSLTVEAHKIFQSFPDQRELTRAAIHIEMFIDLLRSNTNIDMNELSINNKLGASVMFDAIFQACRQRNIDPETGKILPMQKWRTLTDTFAERLPEAPIRKGEETEEEVTNVITPHMDSDVDLLSQSPISGGQNPHWFEEWENHMSLFQIGVEQWDDVDMDQVIAYDDSLGGPGNLNFE